MTVGTDGGRRLKGVDIHCVAEVIVLGVDSASRRGSGYLISPDRVLTATHVVQGATDMQVRLDADTDDELIIRASEWFSVGDVTVLLLEARANRDKESSATFGTLTDRAAVVEMHAIGFPRFKLRDDVTGRDGSTSRYRDHHHAVGWTAVLSNRRSGTFELNVSPPERDTDPAVSPWEGMSGSAVWAAGKVVGVVSFDDQREGLNRLTVSRIDRCLETAAEADRQRLGQLLGLTGNGQGLYDVTPRTAEEFVLSAYREQIQDIAPAGGLQGRQAELEELAQFCASNRFYMHLQAPPWAGKTALTSWFVLHPPAGVDVVSFFVTARLSSQADSDAFNEALIEQLAAYLETAVPSLTTLRARDGHRRLLLREAASRAISLGRRLVLVVDGLDEDIGAQQDVDRSSIASLLPKQPIPGLQVIVTRRSHPPLPAEVVPDHPLRTCPPTFLEPSTKARNIKDQAVRELRHLLNGTPLVRDIIGFIAASGGGLTAADMCELVQQPPYLVEGQIESSLGRVINQRLISHPNRERERVYIFAHETLQESAQEQIGELLLEQYRGHLHSWADSYKEAGWLAATPYYLLGEYARLIEQSSDWRRLVSYAIDIRRQDRLFAVTGGDAAALAEIRAAQSLVLRAMAPDLNSMVRLAVHRVSLEGRNSRIPPNLPQVLGLLGLLDKAEALASAISNPEFRIVALICLAVSAAEFGDYDFVENIVKLVPDDDWRMVAWGAHARAVARHDNSSQVERMATAIGSFDKRAEALLRAIAVSVRSGDSGNMDLLLDSIYESGEGDRLLVELAGLVARIGDLRRAEGLAGRAAGREWKAQGLVAVASQAAVRGEAAYASRLIAQAEELVSGVSGGGDHRARVLMDLVGAAANLGDLDRAQRFALSINDRYWRAQALTDLARGLASAGEVRRAQEIAEGIDDSYWRARAFLEVSESLSSTVDPESATYLLEVSESAVVEIADVEERTQSIIDLAIVNARNGNGESAAALLNHVADPFLRAEAIAALSAPDNSISSDYLDRAIHYLSGVERAVKLIIEAAVSVLNSGAANDAERLLVRARKLIPLFRDPYRKAYLLSQLATVSVQLEDYDQANEFVAEAERTARMAVDPERRIEIIGDLAIAAAVAGDINLALRLTETLSDVEVCARTLAAVLAQNRGEVLLDSVITVVRTAENAAETLESPVRRAQTLAELARAMASVNGADEVEELLNRACQAASTIDDAFGCARTLLELLSVFVSVDGDQAQLQSLIHDVELLLDSIYESGEGDRLLVELAGLVARIGDLRRAEGLAGRAAGREWKAQGLVAVASQAAVRGEAAYASRLIAQAEELVSGVSGGGDHRARVLMDLVGAAANLGDLDRAQRFALSINDRYWRAQALTDLARGLASAGEVRRAQEIAEGIDDSYWRARAFLEVSESLSSTVDPESATYLLEVSESAVVEIADVEERTQSIIDLAIVNARNGNARRAIDLLQEQREVVSNRSDGQREAGAISVLAIAAARLGSIDLARTWVRDISDSYWRARTLVGIVEVLCDGDSIAEFEKSEVMDHLLAEALAVAKWQISLNAIAHTRPTVIPVIAEEVKLVMSHWI
ncbi:trypsin-like peptidase domain-containing protein [Actinoallomurus vinaceus]